MATLSVRLSVYAAGVGRAGGLRDSRGARPAGGLVGSHVDDDCG